VPLSNREGATMRSRRRCTFTVLTRLSAGRGSPGMFKNKGHNPTKRGALKAVDSLLNAVGEMSEEFQRQVAVKDVHAPGRAAARQAADMVPPLPILLLPPSSSADSRRPRRL
jgi:hypothetical protein